MRSMNINPRGFRLAMSSRFFRFTASDTTILPSISGVRYSSSVVSMRISSPSTPSGPDTPSMDMPSHSTVSVYGSSISSF